MTSLSDSEEAHCPTCNQVLQESESFDRTQSVHPSLNGRCSSESSSARTASQNGTTRCQSESSRPTVATPSPERTLPAQPDVSVEEQLGALKLQVREIARENRELKLEVMKIYNILCQREPGPRSAQVSRTDNDKTTLVMSLLLQA